MTREGRLPMGHGILVGEEVLDEQFGEPIPKILLDTLEYIYGHECWWTPERDEHFFPFEFSAFGKVRLYEGDDVTVDYRGETLEPGTLVRVQELAIRKIQNIVHVVARIEHKGETRYISFAELDFPMYSQRPKPN